MSQYSTGTASVTNGSATVTGSGTLWLANVSAGDSFTVAGDGVMYDVASVDSDTQITLSAPYAGTTASGAVYTIARDFTSPDNFPELTTGDIETPTIITRALRKIQGKFSGIVSDIGGKADISGQVFTGEITYYGAGAGGSNTSYGEGSLSSNTSGIRITSIGHRALAANTSGVNNTALGRDALGSNDTGSENTGVGTNALLNNTGGSNNTGLGKDCLEENTTGNINTGVGRNALNKNTIGDANTAIGKDALFYNTTGSGNTAVNPHSSAGSYAPVFNPTTQDNRFCMGSTAVTDAYIQVAWTVVSDARDKTNFGDVPHGLNFVNGLQPTSYQFRVDRDSEETSGRVRYGFKAQDVLELEGNSPVIVDAEDPEKLRMVDTALIPVLVQALQELDAKFEAYVLAHP